MADPTATQARLRASLKHSTDPRVSRTRSAGVAAVAAIHARGEQVTVSAIVREAGISRSSFYAHFSGLEDVAADVMRGALAEIAEIYEASMGIDGAERSMVVQEAQRRLVAHFAENRELYLAVASLPVTREVHAESIRILGDHILSSLEGRPWVPSSIDPVLAARYSAGAAVSLLEAWMSGEVEADAATIASHLTRLLPHWISGLDPEPGC